MKTILFLCTGNYYRSRFAEILFNDLAQKKNVNWKAYSRGLRVGNVKNIGPISPHAVEGLKIRNILLGELDVFPVQVTVRDFEEADMIVALKKAEHESYIVKDFNTWNPSVIYWHIHDIDYQEPVGALVELETEVIALLEKLDLE